MKPGDYIVIILIAVWFAAVLRWMYRQRKNGKCIGCSGCDGKKCSKTCKKIQKK